MKCSPLLLGMLLLPAFAAFGRGDRLCKCDNSQAQTIVCLTETQMSARAKHIEMQPDRMGNHINVTGVAAFELMVGKNGHVLEAKVISGQPLAVPMLMGSVNKWRFRPLLRDGVAWRACGRLRVKFSVVENQPKVVEVVRPSLSKNPHSTH